MNGSSRLLGFFLTTMMVMLLGGLFLFEGRSAKQSIDVPKATLPVVNNFDVSSGATSSLLRTPVSVKQTTGTEKRYPPLKKDTVGEITSVPKQNVTTTSTVSVPGPLIVSKPTTPAAEGVNTQNGPLDPDEIIALTNKERIAAGLPALSFEQHLGAMATAKANDMIQKQYFAHVSPDGIDLTKLAQTHGYLYLNVGENLALGDFTSSADVVSGWMHSPGHRANILNKNFTQIGVSAVLGNYEGRNVWYAVQEFGRPLSDCPLPDVALKKKIETYQSEIDSLAASLSSLQSAILSSNLDQETYNAKVADYNSLIESYNGLVTTMKEDIKTYNTQVEAYNTCAGN